MDPEVDPGWQLSPKMLLFFLPCQLQRSAKNAADPLVALRYVWVSFTGALLMFGVVVALIGLDPTGGTVVPWLALGAGLAVGLLTAQRLVLARPLVCDDLSVLAASFRTRFFLAVALSESIALWAFVLTFVLGRAWIYLVFLPFALFGHYRTAPTPVHLQAAQDELRGRGCSLSLLRALRTPAGGPV
jgi:hypothetical protein